MIRLEKSSYITIHGPDGVGKTTVGRKVAGRLNAHGHPAIFFDDWREDNNWHNPFSNRSLREEIGDKSKYFIALQAAKTSVDSMVITELTDLGVTVVKDRGIFDVRADLKYRGFDADECVGPLIREPDLAVLLSVSEAVRQRRLVTKSDVRPEDYQPNLPGHRLFEMTRSLLEQVEARAPFGGVIIDTDNLVLEEVVDTISDRILEI